MNIANIIKGNNFIESVSGRTDIDIIGISNDSRNIKDGYLFAARKGVNLNSNVFIEEALSGGAKAVLTDDAGVFKKLESRNVTVIFAKDALKAYALMSKSFFGNPSEKLKVIGVTGTNGKTTTTFLIKSVLTAAGNKTALIGTIDYEIAGSKTESKNTTPDAYELNEMFAETVNSGGNACVMEVSSHSLHQGRVDGIHFDVAVFTNLTRDHLDYHHDMDKYYSAKKKLFSEILPESSKTKKFAVINNDDPYGKKLIRELKSEFELKNIDNIGLLTYGLNLESDITAVNINCRRDGLSFDIVMQGKRIIKDVYSGLIGSYNVYNILAAVSAAYALSVPDDFIISGIKSLIKVPGRVEKIDTGNDKSPLICIDYAHTDDALERVLTALRELCGGRLISVFGCGGDRDKGKRPLMGMHSTDIADISIITSDNPRSEEPSAIIKEIISGIGNASYINKDSLTKETAGRFFTIEEDRAKAIRLALSSASEEDAVLIAGKGHEDYMIVKDIKFHFSDKEEVLKYYENTI